MCTPGPRQRWKIGLCEWSSVARKGPILSLAVDYDPLFQYAVRMQVFHAKQSRDKTISNPRHAQTNVGRYHGVPHHPCTTLGIDIGAAACDSQCVSV